MPDVQATDTDAKHNQHFVTCELSWTFYLHQCNPKVAFFPEAGWSQDYIIIIIVVIIVIVIIIIIVVIVIIILWLTKTIWSFT